MQFFFLPLSIFAKSIFPCCILYNIQCIFLLLNLYLSPCQAISVCHRAAIGNCCHRLLWNWFSYLRRIYLFMLCISISLSLYCSYLAVQSSFYVGYLSPNLFLVSIYCLISLPQLSCNLSTQDSCLCCFSSSLLRHNHFNWLEAKLVLNHLLAGTFELTPYQALSHCSYLAVQHLSQAQASCLFSCQLIHNPEAIYFFSCQLIS